MALGNTGQRKTNLWGGTQSQPTAQPTVAKPPQMQNTQPTVQTPTQNLWGGTQSQSTVQPTYQPPKQATNPYAGSVLAPLGKLVQAKQQSVFDAKAAQNAPTVQTQGANVAGSSLVPTTSQAIGQGGTAIPQDFDYGNQIMSNARIVQEGNANAIGAPVSEFDAQRMQQIAQLQAAKKANGVLNTADQTRLDQLLAFDPMAQQRSQQTSAIIDQFNTPAVTPEEQMAYYDIQVGNASQDYERAMNQLKENANRVGLGYSASPFASGGGYDVANENYLRQLAQSQAQANIWANAENRNQTQQAIQNVWGQRSAEQAMRGLNQSETALQLQKQAMENAQPDPNAALYSTAGSLLGTGIGAIAGGGLGAGLGGAIGGQAGGYASRLQGGNTQMNTGSQNLWSSGGKY